jgi:predicted RNA binding protein YcfA (HicA-like mRNA interferase family)
MTQSIENSKGAHEREATHKQLRRHGVEVIGKRGKGGHVLAKFGGKQTTIPVHGDTDFDPMFLQKICKQLGIDPKDIL